MERMAFQEISALLSPYYKIGCKRLWMYESHRLELRIKTWIWTHDLCGAALYHLSLQANWELVIQHNDQLPVGLLAQLVERCTGIAEVMGSNPIQAWILFRPYIHYCSSSVHYCENRKYIQNRLSSFTWSLSKMKIIFYWYHFLARIFLLYSTQVNTAFHAP